MSFARIDLRLAALLIGVTLSTVGSGALSLALPSLAVVSGVLILSRKRVGGRG